jgi:D-glutamate cyclase
MTVDEKLAAILAAVQTDPGHRGLARDPLDNLFTATAGDFQAACRSVVEHEWPGLVIFTGFYIPTADPPAFETDGPLGAQFLSRALNPLNIAVMILAPQNMAHVFRDPRRSKNTMRWHTSRFPDPEVIKRDESIHREIVNMTARDFPVTHLLSLELPGPSASGRSFSMRGLDITERADPGALAVRSWTEASATLPTIGIGDGGNEIGMGKIPHETIVKNIPNGDLIHCRVPTDHLIVAGVSNWGAYALAAGIYVLRGAKPPPDLFDPDREREILEVMVREGPLVDGVTGKQTATVDGLTWEEYAKPLIRIREILES